MGRSGLEGQVRIRGGRQVERTFPERRAGPGRGHSRVSAQPVKVCGIQHVGQRLLEEKHMRLEERVIDTCEL